MFKQLETIESFVTPSNMKVTVLYKPDFKQQSMIIGVPFGGIHSNVLNQQGQPYHSGLAHFLEHKLFESESGDIMAAFSSLGANVNAFTSYQETCYYFNTTSNFPQSCDLLLNLVSSCTLSEESVEKEKGIIVSELAMYDAMVDQALVKNMYQALYHTHPIRNDIGGDADNVNAIFKDELMDAFERFYHPSLMQCVCVTNQSIDEVKSLILSHPLAQKPSLPPQVISLAIKEPREVAIAEVSKTMDIEESKGIYALKLNAHSENPMENMKMQFAIRFILEASLTEMNPHYQTWIDEGIINDFFDMDVDVSTTYSYVAFICEHEHLDRVFTWLDHVLPTLECDEVSLNQLKRRYLGMSLKALNKPSSLSKQLIRYALNDLDFFDVLHLFQNMSLHDIHQAKASLMSSLNHVSRVKIEPIDELV